MTNIIVATLYQFAQFDDYQNWRQPLRDVCNQHQIKGTLHLASEGINGTIAGERDSIDAVLAYLRTIPIFKALVHRETTASEKPFKRLKVKLKKEIVTLRVEGIDPTQETGVHVNPDQWNQLLEDPNTIVIDTRNDYEVELGTFKNAINPETDNFVEFPEFVEENLDPDKHQQIAMFCTGGIRCEKATAYLKQQGFKNVYQLNGGILNYINEIPEDQSLWQGQCFVFDERVTV